MIHNNRMFRMPRNNFLLKQILNGREQKRFDNASLNWTKENRGRFFKQGNKSLFDETEKRLENV